MSRFPFGKGWGLSTALSLGVRATGMERATGRGGQWRRGVARQDNTLYPALGVNVGDGGKKRFRIGVEKPVEHRVTGACFDDPSQVHDGDPVAKVPDHRQVMGDEEEGQIEFPLQFLEKVDDLCLNREVECGYRLVGDEQARLHSQCAGDADPLTLAAREFMGIAEVMLFSKANLFHEAYHAASQLLPGSSAMDDEGFTDNVSNALTRVQGRKGVLENQLGGTAECGSLSFLQFGEVFPLEQDLSCSGRGKAEEEPGYGRFAAA